MYLIIKMLRLTELWCVIWGSPRTDEPVGGPIPIASLTVNLGKTTPSPAGLSGDPSGGARVPTVAAGPSAPGDPRR